MVSYPKIKTKDSGIKPVSDIVGSAGELANYADPYELIAELMANRKEKFR